MAAPRFLGPSFLRKQEPTARAHPGNDAKTGRSSMENLEIRALDAGDAADFNNLRLRALKEHPDAFLSTYENESTRPLETVANRLRRSAESSDEFILGAYRLDELIGMAGLFRDRGEKTRHKATIWGVYVPSEWQGRGVGRALLTEAIRLARMIPGLERLNISVVAGNDRARNLYASLGFESYGVEPRALLVDGKYLDEEHMTLHVSTSS